LILFLGEKSLPPNVGVLPSLAEDEAAWFSGILGIDDLVKIDPPRGQFLLRLQDLSAAKQNVLATFDENEENKDNEEEVITRTILNTSVKSLTMLSLIC
jgi:hypothetical protein